MKRKLKVYSVSYASGLFRGANYQETEVYSEKELNKNDFIVVEHIGYGLFIGQILEDISETIYEDYTDEEIKDNIEYRYIQNIDLNDYMTEIKKAERKKELKSKMEEMFLAIDKERKFEYYSAIDKDFKNLYDEYKNL